MSHISDKAMLVKVTVEQWSANKTDKKITQEVAERHGHKREMGRYKKDLVAKEVLGELKTIAGAARQEHYHRTLPWGDDGYRILGAVKYFEYKEAMAAFETQWNDAVAKFVASYPTLIEQAKEDLNGSFNEADYPGTSDIQRKFGFKLMIKPVPEAEDFRVDVGSGEVAAIRQQLEAERDDFLKQATSDAWLRLKDVVSKMATALAAYMGPDGKVARTFHDSLVGNITALLDVIPGLNLTGDPLMDQFAQEIRVKLTAFSPEDLRGSGLARERTAARAEEILDRMNNFILG